MQPRLHTHTSGQSSLPLISSLTVWRIAISISVLAVVTFGLVWRSVEAAKEDKKRSSTTAAITLDQPVIGPGLPLVGSNAPKSNASTGKAGSVLFFHRYTSAVAQPTVINTLLTITNTNPRDGVTAHVFFVSNCNITDTYITLGANQSRTLPVNEYSPNNTGYAVVVATNSQGVPAQFNWLIGSASIVDGTGIGHTANYNALSVAKRTGGAAALSAGGADMVFDNVEYDRLPRQIAVDSISNQNPGGVVAQTDVSVYVPAGALRINGTLQSQIRATAYDNAGLATQQLISSVCGVTSPVGLIWGNINEIAQPNQPGWATFSAVSAADATLELPVLGVSLTDIAGAALHNARNMQVLAWLPSYRITVPVVAPPEPAQDVTTSNQPEATGGATGASDLKPGSVLAYPYVVSGANGTTTINITNTSLTVNSRVRLYYSGLSGVTSNLRPGDKIISLQPGQTLSVDAQSILADQRGWLMAVAIDEAGQPKNHNFLIGSAQVIDASGHVAAFNAIGVAKNSPGTVARNVIESETPQPESADLIFNDVEYDRLPATSALAAVPSQSDNVTRLGVRNFATSFLIAPDPRGSVQVTVYDNQVRSSSGVMGPNEQVLSSIRTPISPVRPVAGSIPSGTRGWLKINASTPLMTWSTNVATSPLTYSVSSWTGGVSGGTLLHALTQADTFTTRVLANNPGNTPPTAVAAPIGSVIEARSRTGTNVRLDARASFDDDPASVLSYRWQDGDRLISTAKVSDFRLGLGLHAIRLTVIDGTGTASPVVEQVVNVVDTTAPVITGIPTDINKTTTNTVGATVTFPLPVAYDMVDGAVEVRSTPTQTALFRTGFTTPVNFTATDAAGNNGTGRMNVTIRSGVGNFPQTGGVAGNNVPILDNLNDQYVPAGGVKLFTLQASDANGDEVTFELINAPAYAQITTVDPVARRAVLQIAPGANEITGSAGMQVVAVDSKGGRYTTLPFRVLVDEVPTDESGSGRGAGGNGGGGGGGGNGAPTAVVKPLPATVKANSKAGLVVTLDGTGSTDPDGDSLTYTWKDGAQIIAQGPTADVTLAYGQHSITLTVTDSQGSSNTSAAQSVEVLPRDLKVISISPTLLRGTGTYTMTIIGEGFTPTSTVSFACSPSCVGGTGITVSYNSREEDVMVLTVRTRNAPSGNRDVYVSNGTETIRLFRAVGVIN